MMEIVRIHALDPATAPPAHASIRGIVTLSWPYSSSTKQCALLLADLDFRLRNKKGQVRIRFTEASAEAVAKARVGIGDELLLQLAGAKWDRDTEAARTPGKSVDGELVFGRRLNLTVVGAEGGVEINVDMPTPPKSPENASDNMQATPLPKEMHGLRSSVDGSGNGAPPLYRSPAFAKRLRLSGEYMPSSAYDPFADAFAPGLSTAKLRTSFGETKRWRYTEKTPSPTKAAFTWLQDDEEATSDFFDRSCVESSPFFKDTGSPGAKIGVATCLGAGIAAAVSPTDSLAYQTGPLEDPVTQFSETSGDSFVENAHSPDARKPQSAMAPPPLPLLQMPQLYGDHNASAQKDPPTAEVDGPPTPKLQAVPNSALPLPSPFPVGEVEAYSMAGIFVSSQRPEIESHSRSELTTADQTIESEIREAGPSARTYHAIQGHAENESDTEVYDELYAGVAVQGVEIRKDKQGLQGNFESIDKTLSHDPERNEVSIRTHMDAPLGVESKPTSRDIGIDPRENQDPNQNESERQEESCDTLPPSQFQTPVKVPAGIFGFDGTSATTAPAHSTPQSEKERIMAQTIKSLFGFHASDAQSPPGQENLSATPMLKLGCMNMGRASSTIADFGDQNSPSKRNEKTLPDKAGSGIYRFDEASLSGHAQTHEDIRGEEITHSAMNDANAPIEHYSSEISTKPPNSASTHEVVGHCPSSEIDRNASPSSHVASPAGLASPSPVTGAEERRSFFQGDDRVQEFPSSQATVCTEANGEHIRNRILDSSPVTRTGESEGEITHDDNKAEAPASDHQPRRETQPSLPPFEPCPVTLDHGNTRPPSAHVSSGTPTSSQNAYPSAQTGSFQINQVHPKRAIEESESISESLGDHQLPTVEDSVKVNSVQFQGLTFKPQILSDFHGREISSGETVERSFESELTGISASLPIEKLTPPAVEVSQDGAVNGPEIPKTASDSVDAAGRVVAKRDITDDLVEQNQHEASSLTSPRNEPKTVDIITDVTADSVDKTESQATSHREFPTSMKSAVSYPTLPPSPLNSQSQREELFPRMPQASQEISTGAMPPTPQLTQRTSDMLKSQPPTFLEQELLSVMAEPISKRAEHEHAAPQAPEPPQKRTYAPKSLSKRLSNVPDVISAWFSPRRSKADSETTISPPPALKESRNRTSGLTSCASNGGIAPVSSAAARGLTTSLAYFTPLAHLPHHLNGPEIDVLAVVTEEPSSPERARSGRRDFYTHLQIADPSLPPSETEEGKGDHNVRVVVFRPWKATLPGAEIGDVVLLRGFVVKSKDKQARLISGESSAWCVWRFGACEDAREKADGGVLPREEVKGPPVEVGEAEREHVRVLRTWWVTQRSRGTERTERGDVHEAAMK